MNSKGIQPRVGMQVVFDWERKRISRIRYLWKRIEFDNGGSSSEAFFMEGNYEIEWIPPTDEERIGFANYKWKVNDEEFWKWYKESGHINSNSMIQIAESLALDGMDIDDVSKIEELMR